MASIQQRRGSKIWTAFIRDYQGRQHCLSTDQTDKNTAIIIAAEWEKAARQKRTKAQAIRVISRLHEMTGGEPLLSFYPPSETTQSIQGGMLSISDLERKNKRLDLLREELASHSTGGELTKRCWEIARGIGCTACAFNKWPTILQFHHIDGDPHNNSLQNLTVLCPNCHRALHRKIAGIHYLSLAELLLVA